MSSPVIPPPLEALHRPFSFYPAILNIEHNKWQYRKATWSEVLVVNARTGQEIWIPRRFLGEISSIEDPVVIVGLLRELEYKAGVVLPYQRRVIEMPVAVGDAARPAPPPQRAGLAPVVGIRLESNSDSHLLRLVGGALVLGIVAAYVAVTFYRDSVMRPRMVYIAREHAWSTLTAKDDYAGVVHKLGMPALDRSEDAGAGRYRALSYPALGSTIVLFSTAGHEATYIGALDTNGNVLYAAPVAEGKTAEPLLRAMPRF